MSILSPIRRFSVLPRIPGRASLLAGAAMMVLTVGAGAAHATVFGGSATFTDTTTGNALNVTASPNPNNFTTTNLTAGASDYMAGFMTLTTTDSQHCFWCSTTDQISLNFVWTQPSTATGNTNFPGDVEETTFSLAPYLDNGQLTWANDTHTDSNGTYAEQTVTFTDGAIAKIDLYDTDLTGTTSSEAASFDVRITDVKDPNPVPEPASMALLGAGMAGIGFARRRKLRA